MPAVKHFKACDNNCLGGCTNTRDLVRVQSSCGRNMLMILCDKGIESYSEDKVEIKTKSYENIEEKEIA